MCRMQEHECITAIQHAETSLVKNTKLKLSQEFVWSTFDWWLQNLSILIQYHTEPQYEGHCNELFFVNQLESQLT